MTQQPTAIALLRGINVAGRNKLPMADLREIAADLGLAEPRTYIQSGNLVFESSEALTNIETMLQGALREQLGIDIPIIVRSAVRWAELEASCPFPDAAEQRAKFLHFASSKQMPAPDAADRLAPYCKGGERIGIVEDGLWIDFNASVGRSKLTPAVLDRCVGSPVTARNWKTVQAIKAMLASTVCHEPS